MRIYLKWILAVQEIKVTLKYKCNETLILIQSKKKGK